MPISAVGLRPLLRASDEAPLMRFFASACEPISAVGVRPLLRASDEAPLMRFFASACEPCPSD